MSSVLIEQFDLSYVEPQPLRVIKGAFGNMCPIFANTQIFLLVRTDDIVRGSLRGNLSLIKPDCALTKTSYSAGIVTDEQNRSASPGYIVHLTETLLLKLDVSNGENLID